MLLEDVERLWLTYIIVLMTVDSKRSQHVHCMRHVLSSCIWTQYKSMASKRERTKTKLCSYIQHLLAFLTQCTRLWFKLTGPRLIRLICIIGFAWCFRTLFWCGRASFDIVQTGDLCWKCATKWEERGNGRCTHIKITTLNGSQRRLINMTVLSL